MGSGAVVPWRMVHGLDMVHGLNMVHGLEGLPVQRCSARKGLGSIYDARAKFLLRKLKHSSFLEAPACCPATLDQLCVVQLDLRLATSLGCLRECAGLGRDHTDPNRVLPFHVIPDRLTERRAPQCRHGLQVSHPDSLVGSGAVVPRYVVHGLEGLSVLWAIRSSENKGHISCTAWYLNSASLRPLPTAQLGLSRPGV